MIRLNPRARPESWTTIDVNLDGDPQPMRVRYWLLAPEDAARWASERLKGYHAIKGDTDAGIDYLLRELSAEQLALVHTLLAERIIDWDLADAESTAEPAEKLPVTPENVAAILGHGAFLRPLFQGLLDASSGAARKNV